MWLSILSGLCARSFGNRNFNVYCYLFKEPASDTIALEIKKGFLLFNTLESRLTIINGLFRKCISRLCCFSFSAESTYYGQRYGFNEIRIKYVRYGWCRNKEMTFLPLPLKIASVVVVVVIVAVDVVARNMIQNILKSLYARMKAKESEYECECAAHSTV